ncbi:hypothetical protein ACGF7W_35005 [Streptomyces sp. NPDC048219]|uniref:hypothetical protein n=1 Tax=Streptomyces TaxID=1883 RepID=UPI003714002F
MARLIATVYVKDPETHQWVTCDAGTEPEARLAALITTASAWEDGKLPDLGDSAEKDAVPGADPGAQKPADQELEKKPRARRPASKTDE